MGRRTEKTHRSHTLPSSPTHSSSSSDFEFTISISPLKSSGANHLCPADELFYKGQLLPLHLSPRLSMVRTLLLSPSPSTSTTTSSSSAASRDSSSSADSHSSFSSDLALLSSAAAAGDCDSSRPSSVADFEDEFKRLHNPHHHQIKKGKYFSLSRFSSVFRKDPKSIRDPSPESGPKADPPQLRRR